MSIGWKILARATSWASSIASVLRYFVFSAVLVSVVMLEAQTVSLSRDHPSSRVIISYMERNFNEVLLALSHVHNEYLVCEQFIGWISLDELSWECLTA